MKEIVNQYLPALQSGASTLTEFANTLLDFDIEIQSVTARTGTSRKGAPETFLVYTLSDRASDFICEVEVRS